MLILYKGDDTDFADLGELVINIDTQLDLTGFTGKFCFMDTERVFTADEIESKRVKFKYTSDETDQFCYGKGIGVFHLFDAEGRHAAVRKVMVEVAPHCRGAEGDEFTVVIDNVYDYNKLGNIPTVNGVPVKGNLTSRDIGIDGANSVEYVEQSLTDEQKETARLNIGASSSSDLSAHVEDASVHVTGEERNSWSGKYDIPNGGIPVSDLSEEAKSGLCSNEDRERWNNKQDSISDIEDIRSGASKGETALQSFEEVDPVFSAWRDGNSITAGLNATAHNDSSVAIGVDAGATASHSVSIGYGARTSTTGSVQLGNGNNNTKDNSLQFRSANLFVEDPSSPAIAKLGTGFPKASKGGFGAVKVGDNINVEDGVISVDLPDGVTLEQAARIADVPNKLAKSDVVAPSSSAAAGQAADAKATGDELAAKADEFGEWVPVSSAPSSLAGQPYFIESSSLWVWTDDAGVEWISTGGKYETDLEFRNPSTGGDSFTATRKRVLRTGDADKLTPDQKDVLDGGPYATDSDVDSKVESAKTELNARIDQIERSSNPNMNVIGNPIFKEGSVSGFSANDYMVFPSQVSVGQSSVEFYLSFATGTVSNAQQNILDSDKGLAFAIRNGKFVTAISINGTAWLGEDEGDTVRSESAYEIKMTFTYEGGLHLVKTFVKENGAWRQMGSGISANAPVYATTTYWGGANPQATNHIFLGSINLNECRMVFDGNEVWSGYDVLARNIVTYDQTKPVGEQLNTAEKIVGVIEDAVSLNNRFLVNDTTAAIQTHDADTNKWTDEIRFDKGYDPKELTDDATETVALDKSVQTIRTHASTLEIKFPESVSGTVRDFVVYVFNQNGSDGVATAITQSDSSTSVFQDENDLVKWTTACPAGGEIAIWLTEIPGMGWRAARSVLKRAEAIA